MAAVAEEGGRTAGSIDVRDLTRKLGLAAIVGIIFFSVSGGPYGLEDTIGESGPGMGLLLIIVTPILWALPASLVVAELATAMPVQGGYYYWVKIALGPFWGFQEGWWSWVTSWVDLAIYPVLFVDYSAYFFPALGENELLRWLVALAVIWPFALPEHARQLVRRRFVEALPGDRARAVRARDGDRPVQDEPQPVRARSRSRESICSRRSVRACSSIMWNYMGWDGLSTVAGEIDNPRRNYPRAWPSRSPPSP